MSGWQRPKRCCVACFAISQVHAADQTGVCRELKRPVSTIWGFRPDDCPVEGGASC